MGKPNLQPLKGFRDFLPKDKAFQNWFYQNLKEVSTLYGFEEYDGPAIEPLSLYTAKSSDELIRKQAFTFKDKAKTEVTLRPEMTPTLARIVAANEGSLTFPLKWFTYGKRFRYEAPQKGRGREFFQWDIDILGTDAAEADAEIIAIAVKFYEKLGLSPDEAIIKVNDRTLINKKLVEAGVDEKNITSTLKIIDKKAKVSEKDFKKLLLDGGLSSSTVEKVQAILSDYNLYRQSQRLTKIFDLLSEMGVGGFVKFDPCVVRGLDYYTSTVFEGWELSGQFRAIWGGGRYDNLTSQVGSKQKIPGVGFAMGDMVMEEVLKIYDKYPSLSPNKTQVLVTIFSPDLYSVSLSLSRSLRESGINTELYCEPTAKLDKQLKYADKKGVPFVAIMGPEEAKSDTVTIKNMKTQTQKTVFVNAITSIIK